MPRTFLLLIVVGLVLFVGLLGFVFPTWYTVGKKSNEPFDETVCKNEEAIERGKKCVVEILKYEKCCGSDSECDALLTQLNECDSNNPTQCLTGIFENNAECVVNLKKDLKMCGCENKYNSDWLKLDYCQKDCIEVTCREAYQEELKFFCD